MLIDWDPPAAKGGWPEHLPFPDLLEPGKPFLMNLLSSSNMAPELLEQELPAGLTVEIETTKGGLFEVTLLGSVSLFELTCGGADSDFLNCVDSWGQFIAFRRERIVSLWVNVLLVEQFRSIPAKRLARLHTWAPLGVQVLLMDPYRRELNSRLPSIEGRITACEGRFTFENDELSLVFTKEHLATFPLWVKQELRVGEELRGPVWLEVSEPGAPPQFVEANSVTRSAKGTSFELAHVDADGHFAAMVPNPDRIYKDLLQ
jgi:hypothetical protein